MSYAQGIATIQIVRHDAVDGSAWGDAYIMGHADARHAAAEIAAGADAEIARLRAALPDWRDLNNAALSIDGAPSLTTRLSLSAARIRALDEVRP